MQIVKCLTLNTQTMTLIDHVTIVTKQTILCQNTMVIEYEY